MADTSRSKRLIAGFIREANDLIVPFIGGLIASFVARHVANGFWEALAVFVGVFVIYSVIVGLLKRAWVRRSPN
jgi:putative Mn2+ efflux pump MntP